MTARKKLYTALMGAVLLAAAGLLLYRLDSEAFQDYDEATYAEITNESLAHGNFLSLTFLNNPYFRKPPLLFWLTSASAEIIPDPEFAARLPGALAALALILLAMLLCYEASGSAASALLAGTILATTAAFIEPARQVRFDHLVSLFVVAVLYAAVRARRNPRWYIAVGALLGFAILAKGVMALFGFIALISYVLYASSGSMRQRLSFLRSKYIWGGVLAFLVVALPWHLYETYRFGAAFWQSYVGNEVLARAQVNLFVGTNAPTNEGYAWYLASFAAPWMQLFCAVLIALPFLYRRIDARIRPVLLSSLVTAISVLAVMAASHTKAISYLIPFYPFMAIVIALSIYSAWRVVRIDARIACATALAICIPFGLMLTVYDAFHLNPYYAGLAELAQEEKAAGERMRALSDAPAAYAYEIDTIGSIQYYAALPFTNHPYLLVLSDSSDVAPGSLVVTTVSEEKLAQEFPQYRFTPEYQGADVSLFRID